MEIKNFLDSGQNVLMVVSSLDLQEYSLHLIEKTREMLETTQNNSEKYLTASEAAAALKCDRTTLWRWEKSQYLVPVKIGSRLFYRRSDIDNLKGGNA